MADFTIWRFHECNAHFTRDFLGDKKRVLFWLAAFLLVFWDKRPVPADTPDLFPPALLSACGAFLILILTSFIAGKRFGRTIEILSGWLLLTCPGFLQFARSGTLLPFAAALEITALIYALAPAAEPREKTSFFQGFIFGILCGGAAWCGAGLGTILFLTLWILTLRNPPLPGWKAVLGFLCGLTALPILLLLRTRRAHELFRLQSWLPPARPEIPANDVLFCALAPWFWLIPAALGVLNRRILSTGKGPERDRMHFVFAISSLLLVLCGWFALGFASALPCFAVLTAWALAAGREKFPHPRRDYFQILLRLFDLLQIPLIACAIAAPLLLVLIRGPVYDLPPAEAVFYLFRLPAAGLAAVLWDLWTFLRLKRGKNPLFLLSAPALDRILPSMWMTLLILVD